MERQSEQPFDSIESAYGFHRVLFEAVADAKREIEQQIQAQLRRESSSKASRRLDALRLVHYKVEKLEFHTNCNRRILNDLRTLRRLLFEERTTSIADIPSKPAAIPAPETPTAPMLAPLPSPVAHISAKGATAVAA